MALPCAQALRQSVPDEKLIAVIDPSQKDLFDRSGLDFEVWAYSKSERPLLTEKLKTEKPDVAYLLTNSFGSYLAYTKARVPKRIGFGGKWTKMLLTHPADRSLLSLPQGERWIKLVQPDLDRVTVQPLLKIKHDPLQAKHLLLFPGAKYGPAKQWTPEAYSEVVNKALAQDWQVSLVGTDEEVLIGHQIEKLSAKPVNMMFGTHNLKALMEHVETLTNPIVLANDSGAMHLMSACGIPTLGLYFSTSAKNTPPAFGPYKIIEADIDCRPCYKRTCPFQHYDCRQKISPEMAWESLKSL